MGALEAGLGKADVEVREDPADLVDAGDLIRADSWRVDGCRPWTPTRTES